LQDSHIGHSGFKSLGHDNGHPIAFLDASFLKFMAQSVGGAL
jgi:hypothetical protein